jgi:polygalacturonase
VQTPASCFTPDTVKNTDGFDPAQSSNVLLAYSYISTGDDDVAVKSGKDASSNLNFAHNHFYYGHGMSIGSETNGGLSNLVVSDLSIDGFDSANGNGLCIKSDSSREGKVDTVSITASSGSDVTVSGSPGSSTAVDCSAAFVPLSSAL